MGLSAIGTGAVAPFLDNGVWSAGAAMLTMSIAALAVLPLIKEKAGSP